MNKKIEHKIKDTKLDPLPKTIRAFKYVWLKEKYQSYSDKQIVWLIHQIIKGESGIKR